MTLHELKPFSTWCFQCNTTSSGQSATCIQCVDRRNRDDCLQHFIQQLWDAYPLFHPASFVLLFRYCDKEENGFKRVFDALASLGALYLGNEMSATFYDRAKEGLEGLETFEALFTYIILVYLFKLN
jgi:hypothetical protein